MKNETDPLNQATLDIFRVLRRSGFRGGKNQVSETVNTFSNHWGTPLFFREVFSALGFALQPLKGDISDALATQSVFLATEDHKSVDFKIKSKSKIDVRLDGERKYTSHSANELKNLKLRTFKIVSVSEDLREVRDRLTQLNPIRTLGTFRLIWVSVAALFSNILALASSIFIMVVYDRVIPNAATESLYALAIGVILAITFDSLLRSAKSGIINRATEGSDLVVNEEIYNQFVELSGAENKRSIGELSTVVRDLETYRDFMSTATLLTMIDLPFILIFIYVISLISGPLYLIPLIAVPIVLVSVIIAQPIISKISRSASKTSQSRQSVLMEILGGLAPLRASGAFAIMKRKFMQTTSDNMVAVNRSKNVSGFNAGFMQAVQQIAQVAIIVYGFHLFIEQQITMGAIIATVILSGKAMAPLSRLGQTLSRMGAALVARKNIISFLTLPRNNTQGPSDTFGTFSDAEVEISNVTLRLDENAVPLFSNLNIKIGAGERVAIIGPTGAGKSTIINLISGLVLPEVGSVQIKGSDIRTINRADFFRNVGVVFQEPWLFAGSLRENIAMGFEEVSDQQIIKAIKLSGAKLNDDVSTDILDGSILSQGKNLSGGQKQSIALSRAVLFDQSVLLLDEPSSAMDQTMEDRLIAELHEYLDSRTLILVTHKPNMLKLCERIIVIEGGSVKFDGSKQQYVELVNKK
ncbi:MAG: ATP-binding cassette domain-containing protein [Paracoccaceae bacterium]